MRVRTLGNPSSRLLALFPPDLEAFQWLFMTELSPRMTMHFINYFYTSPKKKKERYLIEHLFSLKTAITHEYCSGPERTAPLASWS
jgi:hypothetical protein